MKIVLLADNRKNELLVNFCIAYSHILEKHDLFSLFHTSKLLEESTDLKVTGISTDIDSSMDQLAFRARYNEIDAVLYLQDPAMEKRETPNHLFSACDFNNIPYASNLATAEILVLAIDRGDLDWRELVR
ncbi:MAG TPA: methylglyoxal synthase [Clostridiaceae bacterium]|nr:methylglyoxal synthase [Clostridiaceae bacterium]